MPLLNYTTEVSADKTISEIQKILAVHGAKTILTEFDDNGYIVALSFNILVGNQEVSFRLPSDWRPVQQVLEKQKVSPKFRTQEQALRVSWRVIKDWVAAQMAIVETRMVTLDQVFLPYVVTKDGQTLYARLKGSNFLLQSGNGTALESEY